MISVVIPVSNQGQRLKKSLQHLMAQQEAPFEVILVDDASTDDSMQVARTMLSDRPDTQLVCHSRPRAYAWHADVASFSSTPANGSNPEPSSA